MIATHQVGSEVDQASLWRVRLPGSLTVAEVLAAVADEPYRCCLLGAWAGGGAVVASDPLRVAEPAEDPFALVTQLPTVVGGCAVVGGGAVVDGGATVVGGGAAPGGAVGGGWFGWFGYRLAQRLEEVPLAADRPVALPDFHLAYYDNVLRQDRAGVWWFEALATPPRYSELEERLEQLRSRLSHAAPPPLPDRPRAEAPHVGANSCAKRAEPSPLRLTPEAAAHHLAAVEACRERIAAGEIFQANICLRLESEYDGDAIDLLQRALQLQHDAATTGSDPTNPTEPTDPTDPTAAAPTLPQYTAAFDTPEGGILSLSPELFLRRAGRHVRSGPIKGTAPRSGDPEQAVTTLAALQASTKDAAEHVMIVDLMRNDIGRVCEYGSVTAARRPRAEAHPGLWHLVTDVRGTLRAQATDQDLLRATFPPGSVTGAPKVQSLIVIADLESTGREAYTGAVGYVSPTAGLELNVAIRTLELADGKLWLGVGGGIVADSEPRAELDEALIKARPVAAAVGATLALIDRPCR